jgi:hypothetical protein
MAWWGIDKIQVKAPLRKKLFIKFLPWPGGWRNTDVSRDLRFVTILGSNWALKASVEKEKTV